MRTLIGIMLGLTATILAYTLWRPAIAWTLTHNPPATPPGHQPRTRTWRNGIEIV